jgi:thiol-disulfide isomerase/thioredoxin
MFKQRRGVRLLATALALTALGILGYRLLPEGLTAVDTRPASERIEGFSVRTLADERISQDELRGQVVLVNFWATWCGSCRSEMPGFQTVFDEYRDQGFTILSLSIDDAAGTVESFFDEHGYSFPVAMATEDATRRFGATGVPISYLIDQQGEIRWTVHGVLHEADLRAAVQELLESPQVAG